MTRRTLTETEQSVWDAWNQIIKDQRSPVRTVAAQLGMNPEDVFDILEPAESSGSWNDNLEEPI